MNTDFARLQMVEQQVRTWDVDDARVLEALKQLARDQFVPPMYADLAYADTEIPLPHGQCMLRPLLEGRMLHLLGLRESDKVLEIGSGSGYLTACIASLAASVTAVDIFPELVAMAEQNLADAGVGNVEISCGDAMQELPAGEFDAVLVGGSVAAIPEHFTRALAPSGRLLAVVGSAPVMGAVLVSRQNDGELTSTIAFETQIQALIHAAPRPAFSL